MKQPVWSALGAAILLTCLAAFFGTSFIRRMKSVAGQKAVLTKQVDELSQYIDGLADHPLKAQLTDAVVKRAAEDAKRQIAASAVKATAALMGEVRQQIENKSNQVEILQDAFEDEFGRRIDRNNDTPPQYDVGEAPTLVSDPLRYARRMTLWGTAAAAVEAYNAIIRLSQPSLDRYAQELKSQQRICDEATQQWESLNRQCEELQSRISAFLKEPRKHLPSAEEVTNKLRNCTLVALYFGLSDGLAFMTTLPLAVAVWLRTALMAGWFRASNIVPE